MILGCRSLFNLSLFVLTLSGIMAELIAGAFLSSFFQFAFERLASKDFKDLFHKGLVKKLEITLNSINQLLDDAETKQYQNQNVKNWLDNLKHEIYEVDQLLDEIATNVQRKSKVRSFRSAKINHFGSRIKDLLDKLEHLANQKDRLGLKEGSDNSILRILSVIPTSLQHKAKIRTLNQRLRTYNPTKTSWPELVGVEGRYNQCLRTNNPTKKSWHDELVGLTAEEAKRKINRPETDIQVVPQDSHVTSDYKPGRVRLFVDESNN
ncbi:hypothetical protein P8452_19293 [Trifolium repens]|nr:hypothetical protein P8452_19293 [Trifolium repens]